VNQLRASTELLAAIFGGADMISVEVADGANAPTPMRGMTGMRLGINAQVIAMYESGLGHVADPGGGSGYVESLTLSLAQAAWARLQLIQARGGLIQALAEGSLLQELQARCASDIASVERLERPIVGLTHFPASREFAFPDAAAPGAAASADLDGDRDVGLRLGERIEQLRARAEACGRAGAGPQINFVERLVGGDKPRAAARIKQLCQACGVGLQVLEPIRTEAPPSAAPSAAPEAGAPSQSTVAFRPDPERNAWALCLTADASALADVSVWDICEPAIVAAEHHLRATATGTVGKEGNA
jgi:methylmalonyl-CoA mutase